VKSIISDLRQDDLAREILDRVDLGPYGPHGRRLQSVESTKEDFFASVLKSNEMSHARDPSRALRQSRVSREIVSSTQDHGLSVVPTKQWQDNLSQRLITLATNRNASTSTLTNNNYAQNDYPSATQRRRLETSPPEQPEGVPDWSNLYTIDPSTDDEEFRETTNEFGQLSLDENQEVRFHGKASGLHLLGRSHREDDRIEDGIWRLPMARVWPPSRFDLPSYTVDDSDARLPSPENQDILINLYFCYVHPTFPILHKTRFLADYQARKNGMSVASPAGSGTSSTHSTPRPEPSQEISPVLLLSMFAIAARFKDDEEPPSRDGKMWEAGSQYLESARKILNSARHSRPSYVQALILLGYREWGLGSMEQAWALIGMGIRMAYDLGLNCDSSKWKLNGHDLFSPEETQIRRQTWWAACMCDRYGALYMGRPVMIKEEDFDTPLPDVDPNEDRAPWQPLDVDGVRYHPQPARHMSCFNAASRLAVIVGAIISKVYPINPPPMKESRSGLLADFESRLDQWYYTLPEYLRLDPMPRRTPPPPHVLFLHIRYWGAVLLLHRAFIPNWKRSVFGTGSSPVMSNVEEAPRQTTIGYRAFDLARGAACQVSSIITTYLETFTLKRASPFMTSYLLSAGIMHVLTLALRPENVESALGLQQLLNALKDLEHTWPSATRAWELLNGARVGNRVNPAYTVPYQSRSKRPAEDDFGSHVAIPYSPTQQEPITVNQQQQAAAAMASTMPPSSNGVQDISTRMMAHMLGLEIPGVEPSTSFFPGYEWWPRTQDQVVSEPPGMLGPPITEAPSYATQTADSSILIPVTPVNSVGSNVPLTNGPPPQQQQQQQQQQPPVNWMSIPHQQPAHHQMNDMHLNYAYDFHGYGGH